jgi:hypothetical protein
LVAGHRLQAQHIDPGVFTGSSQAPSGKATGAYDATFSLQAIRIEAVIDW